VLRFVNAAEARDALNADDYVGDAPERARRIAAKAR
jgi:hypothetical protein